MVSTSIPGGSAHTHTYTDIHILPYHHWINTELTVSIKLFLSLECKKMVKLYLHLEKKSWIRKKTKKNKATPTTRWFSWFIGSTGPYILLSFSKKYISGTIRIQSIPHEQKADIDGLRHFPEDTDIRPRYKYTLQHVCCSVLQRVAAYRSVLQCVYTATTITLELGLSLCTKHTHCNTCVAVCCSVLQCDAVCCSVCI